MRRDKLFDIEMYERGEFFGCSVSDGSAEKTFAANQQYTEMPLFTENQQRASFCAKRKMENDTPETDELILLQASYW